MAKTLEDLAAKREQVIEAMKVQNVPDFTLKDRTGKNWVLKRQASVFTTGN